MIRTIARGAVLILVTVVAATLLAGPASAERVCKSRETPTGTVYECIETTPGGNGSGTGPIGSGSTQPPCDLEAPYDDLCIGEDSCWMNDPAAVQDPKELEGTPKPNEDSYVVYIMCQRADGSTYDRWYWSDDVPTITIEDRIRSAIGALDLPTIEASFNPPTRTLVNLPTWWWAEGAPAGEITGSEALGMVAIATPRGLRVTPGNGAAAISCEMSVTKSDTCSYAYPRSGDFTAEMAIVYDIRFEFDGQEVAITDVPEDLRTLEVDDDVQVPVREVQTRVTRVR